MLLTIFFSKNFTNFMNIVRLKKPSPNNFPSLLNLEILEKKKIKNLVKLTDALNYWAQIAIP